jgi:error-prone DNA polymerase
MPDQPPDKRRCVDPPRPAHAAGCYAELHCRTNFSFLEGASHADELVNRASELGLAALAITDWNSVAGVVRAHVAAKETGLKLLIGAEITPRDAPPVILLATDRAAYGRLSMLITQGRRHAPKGECSLTFDDVSRYSAGLLACVPLSNCLADGQSVWPSRYRECFGGGDGGGCYGLAELDRGPNDGLKLDRMKRLADAADVPLTAANNVHYHEPGRQPLHDVLTAVRHGCTVAELGSRRFPNAERHLKSAEAMLPLFADAPEAVYRTREIADRCTFSLDQLRYEYPEELCPAGRKPREYLEQLTWQGAQQRYPQGVPRKVGDLLNHELRLIEELKYEAYFLTVWDLVRFARNQGILCQGRGSAANSAVCFCLSITEVDPDRSSVLFERFMSKERDEPPDIDVDFEHERREEVIQYVYEKYGRDRAGMTSGVITYRMKSAVRDVGKALGFSIDRINRLSKTHDRASTLESSEWLREAGLDPASWKTRQFLHLVESIQHFPRHLSQHVGGMIFTRGRLSELVPIENASMPGRTVVQWDKNDLDALGILKVDCLALGMLTAIRKSLDLIREHEDRDLTLATIPAEDPGVYRMISKADTIGVFQIESRAQMSMLPRLQPRCFYDLVIEVAIVRPGPIQGDMVHPYLRRKCGQEAVTYPNNKIREVLHRTLGVPIFQEQAMQLAVVAAGFTPGEADQLRRAMGAWRRQGIIDQFYRKFIDGMLGNGYDIDFAERLFKQIQGFGEYGFPESHSASFALIAYASAWLKRYHPAAFAAALLNSQPMGFYAPSQLVSDARRHGVEIRPVDVSCSHRDCTLEPGTARRSGAAARRSSPAASNVRPALRLGFRMISGLATEVADSIVRIRELRAYESFDDFRVRTRLGSAVLSRLSQADAFRSLKLERRSALWESLPDQKSHPLFDDQVQQEQTPAGLPDMSPLAQILADYQSTGLSLKGHPLKSFRPKFHELGITAAAALKHRPPDRRVRVAGIVLVRQHPGSARGITFVTLEDETGTANLVIHPDVWNRFRVVARTASAVIARGILQNEAGVIHVVADYLEDLSKAVSGGRYQYRDVQ